MKKYVGILLLVLLLLNACGKKTEPVPTPDTDEPVRTEEVLDESSAPQAAESQALPVVITKNPTDETLEPNRKTWFVAHADNAASITWEFLSPEGAVYSVAETVEKNPGLFLDVSKTDTIALEKVPLSLNSWSVQARFEGPGGSAITAPAKITVKQSLGAYDAIVRRYQAVAAEKASWAANDVSEMILYADHVGYALKDLDNNGVEELIIAGIGYDIPEEPCVFDVYTTINGAAVNVCRSQARARVFLMRDGKFYLEGSSGAFSSNFSVMQYSPAGLQFLNGLYTAAVQQDGSQDAFAYYYTTSNQYGDLASMENDNAMDEKVAQTFLNSWRGDICLPELSFIA